ncbi:tRNA-specific adenosine deaminase [Alphaproteobacteria bacterium]|nr:tRNA-specific adenosine deaminase [Alphaproteobacteria bacterium]
MNDKKYMRLALEMSKKSLESGELPFGAVIVDDGEIIAKGRCREAKEKTVLAHAELEAVDKVCKKLGTNKLKSCTIYCTNEPCPMCAAAIFQAKIPRVVIGASREDLPFLRKRRLGIYDLAKDSGYEIEIVEGVLRDDVLTLFAGTK